MTKTVTKEVRKKPPLGRAWEVGKLGNERPKQLAGPAGTGQRGDATGRPKQPAAGPDPSEKTTIEIPKRARNEKLSPLNIEAIQRLRRGGSSILDIEAFTGFGHSTIARYCEGIEPMEKYSPKPVDATGQTALPSGQTASQPQPAQTDEQIAQQYPPHRPENAPYAKPASPAPSLVVERANGEKPPDVTTSDVMNLKVVLDPETLLVLAGCAILAPDPEKCSETPPDRKQPPEDSTEYGRGHLRRKTRTAL